MREGTGNFQTVTYSTWLHIRLLMLLESDARSRMSAAILNLQGDRGSRKGARMERLTQKAPDSEMVWFKDKERLFEPCEMSAHQSRLAIAKLAAYESAEEQGLLLRLPCKVGDTVYLIKNDGKIVARVADMMFIGVLWEEFGKTVFLTRTEAEAKLAEMEGAE